MSKRISIVVTLAIAATLPTVPVALAQTAGGGGSAGGAAYGAGPAADDDGPSDATGGTGLVVAGGAMLGGTLEIGGTMTSAAGQIVRIERLDPDSDTWIPVARAKADSGGHFEADWATDAAGVTALRAVPDAAGASQAAAAASAPTGRTAVYRPAKATWYGPGFWGHKTACGVKLTKTTIGVAHKSLPCGAKVALFYGGRTITAPVIDRGPFTNGLVFDLTQATAQALAMPDTTRIGWLPGAALAAPDR
jgi:peptidoglycan lytic transglycosylase